MKAQRMNNGFKNKQGSKGKQSSEAWNGSNSVTSFRQTKILRPSLGTVETDQVYTDQVVMPGDQDGIGQGTGAVATAKISHDRQILTDEISKKNRAAILVHHDPVRKSDGLSNQQACVLKINEMTRRQITQYSTVTNKSLSALNVYIEPKTQGMNRDILRSQSLTKRGRQQIDTLPVESHQRNNKARSQNNTIS